MTNRTEHIAKRELLSRVKTSRDAVASLLAALPPEAFLQSDAIDRWSVRDLLAHFVAHEQRALAEIAAARRGERLPNAPTGADAFNAGAVFAWALFQPADARAAWDRSYRRVVEVIEELAEADLAPGSALEQALGDTVDGALANNTYTHYAEHLPALEVFVARFEGNRSGVQSRPEGCGI
jgi:Mycothiol maleylpyruvate isomerase N-terminal domain